MIRFLLSGLCAIAAAADWTPTTWREQPALQSVHAGWTATVCPAWGRLVGLRAPDGTEVLRVPEKPFAELRGGAAGGHMVWLCPQSRWGWPPPEHWEYAAGEPRIDGQALELRLPAGTVERPGLTRRYAWIDAGLRCTVSWQGPGRWYALQVFQVRGDAEVRLQAKPSPGLPNGFAASTGPDAATRTDAVLPQPCLTADGADVRVWRGAPFQKLFFPYQPIRVRIGSTRISLERLDRPGEEPEDGRPTMIFSGALWDMIEVEQASTWREASAAAAEASVVLRIVP